RRRLRPMFPSVPANYTLGGHRSEKASEKYLAKSIDLSDVGREPRVTVRASICQPWESSDRSFETAMHGRFPGSRRQVGQRRYGEEPDTGGNDVEIHAQNTPGRDADWRIAYHARV